MPTFTVAGSRVELDRDSVERALESIEPEPLRDHYVVVGRRRYPPKQVLCVVTGLDRADFTTHQARRILRRLGFVAARRSRSGATPGKSDLSLGPHGGRQAGALEPYVGQWVALGEPDEVLFAADSAQEVVSWLTRNERRASGIFRVPATAREAEGAAPL
jgi:hypothetical protein